MKEGYWIGVDLDGTLAVSITGDPHIPGVIGEPIPAMVARIKRRLKKGMEIRILTARVSSIEPNPEFERAAIEKWCEEHIGQKLRVTAEKDYKMVELWDDRARQAYRNTGELVPSVN